MAGDTMTKSIEPADEVIRGGTIIDGTGRPRFRSDVAVKNGRITAIGDLAGLRGRTEINAEGLVVAPGFIDAHAHSDTAFVRDGIIVFKSVFSLPFFRDLISGFGFIYHGDLSLDYLFI